MVRGCWGREWRWMDCVRLLAAGLTLLVSGFRDWMQEYAKDIIMLQPWVFGGCGKDMDILSVRCLLSIIHTKEPYTHQRTGLKDV